MVKFLEINIDKLNFCDNIFTLKEGHKVMDKKKSLLIRILENLKRKKILQEEKVVAKEEKMTQQELEEFYKNTYAECQYEKRTMSSLDKAEVINNELWLNGQGG